MLQLTLCYGNLDKLEPDALEHLAQTQPFSNRRLSSFRMNYTALMMMMMMMVPIALTKEFLRVQNLIDFFLRAHKPG